MTGLPNLKETPMRRDTFLKSMAALAVGSGLPLSALAGMNVKMMIPANPGGGCSRRCWGQRVVGGPHRGAPLLRNKSYATCVVHGSCSPNVSTR